MSVHIQGVGWITPSGRDLDSVSDAVKTGIASVPSQLTNPFNNRSFPVLRVDPSAVEDVSRHPRLRRSSMISHFAVAAALDALRDAGCDASSENVAIVFAATNGGVIYTRRFFEEISKTGTHAGSPLLFPETVYNAPASHIAAVLGITGSATTLVNDATAAADALAAACELLDSGVCERCLVVAAEEADWAICEACATWRLAPVFAEGAAALLLGRDGDGPVVERIHGGATFPSIPAARRRLAGFAAESGAQILVSSASGTAFDEAEADLPPVEIRLAPKVALGEAFAASALMQVACAALALRGREKGARAFVPITGFNGQVAALTLQDGRR